ncbi:MAG TPA: hypothetical protein VEG30_17180 [Terriglobales bacterium]|nr:hypothetical protein [Terriglobales bacterium]
MTDSFRMRNILLIFAVALAMTAGAQNLRRATRVTLPATPRSVQFSPSGQQVAVLAGDDKLRLINLPSGQVLLAVDAQDKRRITAFAYSGDGRWLAVGDRAGAVSLIDSRSGSVAKKWTAAEKGIDTLVLSADGSKLAVGAGDLPGRVWDTASEPALRLTTHPEFGGLTSAAFSSDAHLLLTADGDTVVRLYDVNSGKKLASNRDLLLESFGTAFIPDGHYAVVGGADPAILFFDPATGKTKRKLGSHPGVVDSITAAPDGKHLIVTYFDATGLTKPMPILYWDIATEKSQVISDGKGVIGCGVAKDQIWVATAKDNTLELWRWE